VRQGHIASRKAHGGMMALATEKWQTYRNEQEVKKLLSEFYSPH
jgi:hypothetical protein